MRHYVYSVAALIVLVIGIMPTMAQTNTPQPTYTLTPTLTPTPSPTPTPTYTPGGPTITPTFTPSPMPTDVFWRAGDEPGTTSDCGYGLPCGPIPWPLPVYGVLSSPTPAPTRQYNVTITPTATATGTATPTITPGGPTLTPTETATPAPTGTTDPLSVIGTISAIDLTPGGVDINGDPVEFDSAVSEISASALDFFGYVRAVLAVNFGVLQPLFDGLILAFAFAVLVKLTALILPMASVLVGVVRKIIQLVLDFIPG